MKSKSATFTSFSFLILDAIIPILEMMGVSKLSIILLGLYILLLVIGVVFGVWGKYLSGKEEREQIENERKRLEKEERTSRPDIKFKIYHTPDKIQDYIVNARFCIENYRPDNPAFNLKIKIKYNNKYNNKVLKIINLKELYNKWCFNTKKTFRRECKYLIITHFQSNKDFLYYTIIKVKHVRNAYQQYWKIIHDSQRVFIKKGKKWILIKEGR